MKIKHTALLLAFVLACGTITTSCSSSDNTVQEDTLTSCIFPYPTSRHIPLPPSAEGGGTACRQAGGGR